MCASVCCFYSSPFYLPFFIIVNEKKNSFYCASNKEQKKTTTIFPRDSSKWKLFFLKPRRFSRLLSIDFLSSVTTRRKRKKNCLKCSNNREKMEEIRMKKLWYTWKIKAYKWLSEEKYEYTIENASGSFWLISSVFNFLKL